MDRIEITGDELAKAQALSLCLQEAGHAAFYVKATSLANASKVLADFRDDNGFGASDFGKRCGIVFDELSGKKVAEVSYNGRVWRA